MTDMTVPTVFDIRNLTVSFRTQSGLRHVVDKFNLSVKRGEQIAHRRGIGFGQKRLDAGRDGSLAANRSD